MARRYRYEYRKKQKEKELRKSKQNTEFVDEIDIETRRRRNAKRLKRRKRKNREFKIWIISVILILIFMKILTTFIGQPVRVTGESMLPTLNDGDVLIVDKVSYKWSEPERFDIVIFPHKQEKGGYYIKRVIGLPGETVEILEGNIIIDGEKLEEPFIVQTIEEEKYGLAAEPITLGMNEFFVLGDNRNNSADSRSETIGIIKQKDFSGKAWIRIWAADAIGSINP